MTSISYSSLWRYFSRGRLIAPESKCGFISANRSSSPLRASSRKCSGTVWLGGGSNRGRMRHRLGRPGCEPLLHFVGILDVELVVVEAHPPIVVERLAHPDAEEHLVRERVVSRQVMAVVGRHRRNSRLRRKAQQVGQD